MNILGIQLNIAWENKQENYSRVSALLAKAQPAPNTLVVLPEMFATGFSMNVKAIHENLPPRTDSFLRDMAQQHRVCLVAGVVSLGADGRGRNDAVVLSPDGSMLTRYTKMQPFSLGGETQHYAAGESVARFDWEGFQLSPFICYDLRFPEHFRRAAQAGAEVFVVIANWPVKRVQHWVTLLQARAIENQAYVVGVNRAGTDPSFNYPGRSVVVDPWGEILADGGLEEGVIRAELDRGKLLKWRKDFPALADRRPS